MTHVEHCKLICYIFMCLKIEEAREKVRFIKINFPRNIFIRSTTKKIVIELLIIDELLILVECSLILNLLEYIL